MAINKTYIFADMLKVGVKIFHYLILLITGIALVGVNVQQQYCWHLHDSVVEVCMLPLDDGCPCTDGCCGSEGCHSNTRHDFYKITDSSRVEQGVQLMQFVCVLPSLLLQTPPELLVSRLQRVCTCRQVFAVPISREFLCTYIC